MSYRNISINGKAYRYSVGRTHVKIRGVDYSKLLTKAEVGQPFGRDEYVVTPQNIRNIVLGLAGPQTFVCEEHGVTTTRINLDPLMDEVYRKGRLIPDCKKCLDQLAWAI